MDSVVLAHHGEIFLKGNNRHLFVKRLRRNMKEAIRHHSGVEGVRVTLAEGRYVVGRESPALTPEEAGRVLEAVVRTFGIVSAAVAYRVATTYEAAEEAVIRVVEEALEGKKRPTFRIEASRAWKGFPMRSPDLDRQLGGKVVERFGLPVKLVGPDLTVGLEVLEDFIYVYGNKRPGYGGLPVGSAGTVMALLSGGFDSPVAAWLMAKRGCHVAAVHFHSYPYTTQRSIQKVKDLAAKLSEAVGAIHLTHIALTPVQEFLRERARPELLVLHYRRSMIRMAQKLAQERKAQALVTGESLGQVASQTLNNLAVIEDAATIPVLRPVIAYDKNEILKLARFIGTHDISVLPHDDACTLFVPSNPATKGRIYWVRQAEEEFGEELLRLEAEALAAREESWVGGNVVEAAEEPAE